jgi:hypothetical protein
MRIQCVGANNAVAALKFANAVLSLEGKVISISEGGVEHAFIVWFRDAETEDVLALARGRP